MPDILIVETPHFVLTVWTKDVVQPQALLAKTYEARGLNQPSPTLRFNPPLLIQAIALPSPVPVSDQPVAELCLTQPLFFENKLYEFEFLFSNLTDTIKPPAIIHRLRSIEDSFHYKRGCLRGSVNFGNDIGWFRLGVCYCAGGQMISQYLSFEVQATKLAMAYDLEGIYRVVDKFYPLWRFSLVQKTDQALAKSRIPHDRFELLWLAHFGHLRMALVAAIKRICNAPHSRLLPYQRQVGAHRLRGRLPSKLEQRVAGHLANAETHHHYHIVGQRLSLDTPENRFVKWALRKCSQTLTNFKQRAALENRSPECARLSGSFFAELDSWKKPLDQLLNRPLFAEVGVFGGFAAESLVLHQRDGYAEVYRIWQELKLYLDLFGANGFIAMKSVAQLYEVWCLLEVRQILLELGFVEKTDHKALLSSKGLEKSLKDGLGAAFILERRDDIIIHLAHEPIFKRSATPDFGKIYSWTTPQKPDIFLEARFSNGKRVQWIFDAKYRLADTGGAIDLAPDDAINQMHRYRDALIYINKADDGEQEKCRPILGAFVLYPVWVNEAKESNPYHKSIEAVGIGGFPLLPGRANRWLRDFLQDSFGNAMLTYPLCEPDQYSVQESARIGPIGTYLTHYQDLTLSAKLGPIKGRDPHYLQRFKDGSAGWYHIRLSATTKKTIARNVMREVRYCAVAVYDNVSKQSQVTHLYEVKSVRLVKRCDMSILQAGKLDTTNQEEYWLFELGYARPSTKILTMPASRAFNFQLTSSAELLAATSWSSLSKRYATIM